MNVGGDVATVVVVAGVVGDVGVDVGVGVVGVVGGGGGVGVVVGGCCWRCCC